MHCKFHLYLLLSLLLFSSIEAGVTAVKDSGSVAMLEVNHNNAGLAIFLDDLKIGTTPLVSYPISPGQHELLVRSPLWPSLNMADYNMTFTAEAGKTYLFTPQFSMSVSVNSIPYQADIYIDSTKAGVTPLVLFKSTGSDAIVRLEKTGYEPWEGRLSSWIDSIRTIILLPKPIWLQQQEKMQHRIQKKISWSRRSLYGSLLLGIVSGVATIHFRGKGNDAYSAYLETANSSEMERYYSRAVHYDRIAGVSYTVFELSFLASGYFFLKSQLLR